ncbi:serine/threonine-protein kinase [Verrucomicrobiales bacterium BCK34]|nr:serine/threonine-protein kinase [Verrucomicrobiales bacterium BCK34]
MTKIKLPNGVWEYDESQPLGAPGGFGQVFAGKSDDHPQVAIKKIHIDAGDAAHREMEVVESLIGANHKHVIPFLDAGEEADSGEYFVVMEKAKKSLQDDLNQGQVFTPQETATILLDAARGLQEASQFVHRDLKPGNLLFRDSRWMIADFGIARFVEISTSSQTLKSCQSDNFAAPEQWRYESATSKTDIYALGCIGFNLLTGSPPYSGDPQDGHLNQPLPTFPCSDRRLTALLKAMLRKPPESRPEISRLIQQLSKVATEQMPTREGVRILLDAANHVEEEEAEEEARREAIRAKAERRSALHAEAFQVLQLNVENLSEVVEVNIPKAEIRRAASDFRIKLGKGELIVNLKGSVSPMDEGQFLHSKWEIIAFSQVLAIQHSPPKFVWPSLLFYGKPFGSEEYRWYEAIFAHSPMTFQTGLVQLNETSDIDFSLSKVEHSSYRIFGPSPIDDEEESSFHERCLWLLAKASTGELRSPAGQILTWPPYQ